MRTPREAELAADAREGAARHVEIAALPDAGPRRARRGAPGEEVQEGQPLCTVEAMKMENVLRAEKRGVVSRINTEAGASLAVDDVIMEFE